jgi:opacity protein-like surface antigen
MKRSILLALVTATLLAGAATPSSAQSAGDGFLFHRPNVTFGVRGGYSRAAAHSAVFDDVTSNLTLDRGDFSSLSVGGDVAVHVAERVDVVLSADYSRSNHKSEFRDFVDNNDQPIEQTTTFERLPLTVNLRFNLSQAGRSVGSLAWIPNRVVPYVGAGVGAVRYRFRQDGDFVDFNTNAVFPSVLDSKGWAFAAQALAGVEYNLSPRFGLTLDGRYLHAKGELDSSRYKGYDGIDLSGATATVGLSFRL